MIRPDNLAAYEELNLKLGIKSSLPHVKSTLALAVLLWEAAGRPGELVYAEQHGEGLALTDETVRCAAAYIAAHCGAAAPDETELRAVMDQNQLLKSQIEALMVAFELVWKLARVRFVNPALRSADERTSGVRYPKKLAYSIHADIIHSVIAGSEDAYIRVLLEWMGFDAHADPARSQTLEALFTALSENAVFKLADGGRDVVFNQNCVYRKLIETGEAVDVSGDKEPKGPLRIFKSLLAEGMNPFLQYAGGAVTPAFPQDTPLEEYQKRVETFLRLSAAKVVGLEEQEDEQELEQLGLALDDLEAARVAGGTNVLLYGVPGAGKSWTIAAEYCDDEDRMERLVFHPDYTYSDFVGQILPRVSDGMVRYAFTPGPFTALLRKAYHDPANEYFLVIEEINRGNAPAIFGEVFQLLDRKTARKPKGDDGFALGTSEYGISNAEIAAAVYEDPARKVRLPSNLTIIGTMNTSDQNVFTLDTAFQRRWDMRMIDNSFDRVDPAFAGQLILDTSVTWRTFCTVVNGIILEKNVGLTSSEDKRLGVYFVQPRDLEFNNSEDDAQRDAQVRRAARRQNSRFAEKVLKYLWDDAFKFSREDIFAVDRYAGLETVVKAFVAARGNERFSVFRDTVYEALLPTAPAEG